MTETNEREAGTTYYVLISAACMPANCWGRYSRIGLIEVEPGGTCPKIIRDTRTARVVRTWERLHTGKTDRDALSRALVEAEAMKCALEAGVRS